MNKTGQDSRGGLYISRYHAKKEATGAEVVVKVSGGYKIMTAEDYKIWKMQK
nr:MAG TPA: CRISPR-associated protein [Caudoviricetes sp.]